MPVDRALEAAFDAILTDRPIAYRPALARAAGSVTAGILLAQAIYWSPRGGDADGWFYKTQQEWEVETALTRSEWINARKQLRAKGLLHERLRGVPATLHYRVDLERLIDLLGGAAPDRRILRTRSQAPGEPDRRKPANFPLSPETTTEGEASPRRAVAGPRARLGHYSGLPLLSAERLAHDTSRGDPDAAG